MVARKHISLTLGFVFLILFLMGFYLMFFPPTTRVSQQNESWSEISLPTPVPAHSARQVAFSAKAGDYITFNLRPETGFPPGPIIGQITVNIYLGTQTLYSSTADRIDGTVNLPETASYTFQVVNDNDFEVSFESAGFYASSLKLHSIYLEYSEKSNTPLQSAGFMLLMASFIVGAATLLIVTAQAKKT